MAIHLNPGEEIRIRGNIHWITYLRSSLIAAGIIVFGLFGVMATYANNNEPPTFGILMVWVLIAVLSIVPISVRWLQNKCTTYLVTNQRVYFEEGVLSHYSSDIPLEKINDVTVRQSIFQRLLGSGTVMVLTGNDAVTEFENLANLEAFRSAIRRK